MTRKNPDKICFRCGGLIEDRTYRSACYCSVCYPDHRREYKRLQMRKKLKMIEQSKLEIIAAGMLIENYMEVTENEFGII